ncbi:MAG TPA: WYL domain-containing protein [Caulobacteraceae bacterium]|jgi:predicted DNA-binding transcriptional regulator YafY
MRHEKPLILLKLARRLAGTAEGLTLDEMARETGVDRRTAERMRDALRELFSQLEELRDGRGKRFRIPGGLDGFIQAPSVDELAELQAAIAALAQSGGDARAELLRGLLDKIRAALRAPTRLRMEPDLEALAKAETLVMQVGPRPLADGQLLAHLREALKAMRVCAFRYAGGSGERSRFREVTPYGILFGRDYYLVGPQVGRPSPVLWRLDRIRDLELGETCDGPPEGFDLAAFAARSFGTYQEPPEGVVLRFAPAVAEDAQRFQFHPSQTLTDEADGSLTVSFRAGGLNEIVHHLFIWGAAVEILEPPRLRTMMVEALASALAKHSMSGELAAPPCQFLP